MHHFEQEQNYSGTAVRPSRNAHNESQKEIIEEFSHKDELLSLQAQTPQTAHGGEHTISLLSIYFLLKQATY